MCAFPNPVLFIYNNAPILNPLSKVRPANNENTFQGIIPQKQIYQPPLTQKNSSKIPIVLPNNINNFQISPVSIQILPNRNAIGKEQYKIISYINYRSNQDKSKIQKIQQPPSKIIYPSKIPTPQVPEVTINQNINKETKLDPNNICKVNNLNPRRCSTPFPKCICPKGTFNPLYGFPKEDQYIKLIS